MYYHSQKEENVDASFCLFFKPLLFLIVVLFTKSHENHSRIINFLGDPTQSHGFTTTCMLTTVRFTPRSNFSAESLVLTSSCLLDALLGGFVVISNVTCLNHTCIAFSEPAFPAVSPNSANGKASLHISQVKNLK